MISSASQPARSSRVFARAASRFCYSPTPVDAFWVSTSAGYEGKPFKSVTQGAADIKAIPLVEGAKPQPGDTPAAVATLFAFFKQTLGDQIEDVRRLRSPDRQYRLLVAPELWSRPPA